MKLSRSALFWIFIWSIFMGVTAISIGFGAVFPSMNRIAKPFICPQGTMELETQDYRPSPGTTVTTLTWYCVEQKGEKRTKLGIFPMSLYAGVIYGLLLFVLIVIGSFLYQRWEAYPKSPAVQKWAAWIQNGLVILFVAGMILFGMRPLFRSAPPTSTSTPDSVATSVADTFHELSSGTPVAFTATEKPLTKWQAIPIMSEAIAGQEVNADRYAFQVPADTGKISYYYKDTLKSLGWTLDEDQWLGMKFTKDTRILLVTLAPNSDLQSWVVTLVLIS